MTNKTVRGKLIREGKVLLTFNQWKKEGYAVKKGELSPCRTVYGTALFTNDQVYTLSTEGTQGTTGGSDHD